MAETNRDAQNDPFALHPDVKYWVDKQLDEYGGVGIGYQQDAAFNTYKKAYSAKSKGNPLGGDELGWPPSEKEVARMPDNYYAVDYGTGNNSDAQAEAEALGQQMIEEQRQAAAAAAAAAVEAYAAAKGLPPLLGGATARQYVLCHSGGDITSAVQAAVHEGAKIAHNQREQDINEKELNKHLSLAMQQIGLLIDPGGISVASVRVNIPCHNVPDASHIPAPALAANTHAHASVRA